MSSALFIGVVRPVLAVGIGYVLGSILPARLLARQRGVDISRVGDGNPGTVNAFRGLGMAEGVLTLLYDASVGIVALLIASQVLKTSEVVAYAAGLSAIVGHRFPLFRNARPGGQGMAASAGLLVYGLIVAGMRGHLPLASLISLVIAAAAVFAVTRSGAAVSVIVLPLALAQLLLSHAEWPLVALVAVAAGRIWFTQLPRFRVPHFGHSPAFLRGRTPR